MVMHCSVMTGVWIKASVTQEVKQFWRYAVFQICS
jgi:hypothetical protein